MYECYTNITPIRIACFNTFVNSFHKISKYDKIDIIILKNYNYQNGGSKKN